MSKKPVLILQMQRMGDLVLSFPLLGWLGQVFPGHPLWVVGEERFYEPLMPLSPTATYFSYAESPHSRVPSFQAVINLSHRPEPALIAGLAGSELRIGPWRDEKERLFINGSWQLYRASLTHNNRYNLFHWADLNALDLVPEISMRRTVWPPARALAKSVAGARVGLFLGASEAEKRPDAEFWATLTRFLLNMGMRPALLGGKAELPLGTEVAGMLKATFLNLCDRFSVSDLARFLSELDLLITPDTGPMHVAAWTGTPCLNLSLGPVNPWETGPCPPGHHVLRAVLDCVGCWRCIKERAVCREAMAPGRVAAVVEALFAGDLAGDEKRARLARRMPGLELLRGRRDRHGLYDLENIVFSAPYLKQQQEWDDRREGERRAALSRFWQAWFGARFKRFAREDPALAWRKLVHEHPGLAPDLKRSAARHALELGRGYRGSNPAFIDAGFWREADESLRPLSGYIQMHLQNNLGSREAFAEALSMVESIAEME